MNSSQSVSKFASILAVKHGENTETDPKSKTCQSKVETQSEKRPTPALLKSALGTANGTRRGRPPAKRSDPDFVQTSPYIRKTTLLAVKSKLLHEGEKREYSELVEELLNKWLNT